MHDVDGNPDDLIDDGSSYCMDRSMGDDAATAQRELSDHEDGDASFAARIVSAAVADGSLCPQYR